MSEDMLEEWLRDQGIQNGHRVKVTSLQGSAAAFNIMDPRIRMEWSARLRADGSTILILDCIRPVLDALGLNEKEDAGRFFVAFDQMCHEAGIREVVAVHHMGHGNERSRGDSRIRDWPAAEWRMVRKTDNPASPRFITAFGRGVNIE